MRVHFQKIRVMGLRPHYQKLMQEIHHREILQLLPFPEMSQSLNKNDSLYLHTNVLSLGRVNSVLGFLSPYRSTKNKWKNFFCFGKIFLSKLEVEMRFQKFAWESENIVFECELLNDLIQRTRENIVSLESIQKKAEECKKLPFLVGQDFSTDQTFTVFGTIKHFRKKSFLNSLARVSSLIDIEIFDESGDSTLLRLTIADQVRSDAEKVFSQFDFSEVNLVSGFPGFEGKFPAQIAHVLGQELQSAKQKLAQSLGRITFLAQKYFDDLKILHDHLFWQEERNKILPQVFRTPHVFAIEAFIQEKDYDEFSNWISSTFKGDIALNKISPVTKESVFGFLVRFIVGLPSPFKPFMRTQKYIFLRS